MVVTFGTDNDEVRRGNQFAAAVSGTAIEVAGMGCVISGFIV